MVSDVQAIVCGSGFTAVCFLCNFACIRITCFLFFNIIIELVEQFKGQFLLVHIPHQGFACTAKPVRTRKFSQEGISPDYPTFYERHQSYNFFLTHFHLPDEILLQQNPVSGLFCPHNSVCAAKRNVIHASPQTAQITFLFH